MRFEKPKKCLDCLWGKLKDDRVYCYEWGVIVLATHARICNRFVSKNKRDNKRKRRKEVVQWI